MILRILEPIRARHWGRAPSQRALIAPLVAAAIAAAGCGSGWTSKDYKPGASDPPPQDGEVKGLTVLVSFPGESISDAQAMKLYRTMNEPGYSEDGNSGSVRDYFFDMSGGALTLESRVVRVLLDEPKTTFDTDTKDEPHAPPGLTSLEGVTIKGPSTELLAAVLCRLRTCDGVAPEYQEVTASSISPPVRSDLDFSDLSTRRLGFWPDNYVRDVVNNSYLNNPSSWDLIDIPDLTIYSHINLLYAGDTSQGPGRGLWPRSIPSIGTKVPGSTSPVRIGRFQLQGTRSAPGSDTTFTGTLIHETAHMLFDLPDLYDAGSELWLEEGSALVESQGIGTHGLLGGTPNENQAPMMSAPLRDRLGWANVVDISDAAEGATIELRANGADVARYCRPESAFDECFYLEVRRAGRPRGPSGFEPFTPDEGLAIWHAENSRSVMDFVVNNHEEGTANLHYEVALVQADGDFELEGPKGTGSLDDDYFHAGHADRFDKFTVPSSSWWDGTPSGLAIHSISAVGDTMTFEMGRRPSSYLHVDADANVQVDAGSTRLTVGEQRLVTVTPSAGYQFDIEILGRERFEATGLSGPQTFTVTGSLLDNHVKVVSFPSGQGMPVFSTDRQVKFTMTNGVALTAHAEDARSYSPRSRVFDSFDGFATFRPGQDASPNAMWSGRTYDMLFRTYAGQPSVRLFAKAEPGYLLKSIDVYGRNHDSVQAHDVSFRTAASATITVPAGAEADGSFVREYLGLVNAEPIPGFFCRDGFVEQWDATKIYHDVGDKVRYGSFIYSSNVPRNFLRGNASDDALVSSPQHDPEDTPTHWTRFASCSAYVEDCSSAPEWSLGGSAIPSNPSTSSWQNASFTSGTQVVFNGRLYELVGNNYDEVPGAFESRQLLQGAEVFASVAKDIPIYSNRAFVHRGPASWKLIGNCNDPQYSRRATVAPSEGVKSISPRGVSSVNHHADEPTVITGLTGAWTFDFELDSGYELVDVVVDGQPLGLSSTARAATVPFVMGRPAYVEVLAACNQGGCGTSAPAQVSCDLGAPQTWGVGFVYSNVRVTNVSGQPLTDWSVRLDFDAPPDLWDSSGVTFAPSGNSVLVSNAYSWSGNLAPDGSYQFSIGGNLSGPFVPPTCTGL